MRSVVRLHDQLTIGRPSNKMKIAQFLCFSPDLAEEQITAVHVLPELPPCNRQRRWRRRLAGIIFPILIRPQANDCTDSSSNSQRRGGQFCNRKRSFESETASVRKSDEAILASSSRSSRERSSSSSSLSSPILPAVKSKEGVQAAAERRCALCLLVVSLMVMVFCGRICAILWTASGLCFLPRRKPAAGKPEIGGEEKTPAAEQTPAAELRRRGFREYEKRRVVMEGFLGRSKRGTGLKECLTEKK